MKILSYGIPVLSLFIFLGLSGCSDDTEDLFIEEIDLEQGKQDDHGEDDGYGEEDDDDDDDDEDDLIIKDSTQFFLRLDPQISEIELGQLEDDLNAEEIWYIEEINLRLWSTTAFPYTDDQGQQVTNIDGQVARARTRASVNSIDFNIGSKLNLPTGQKGEICFADNLMLVPAGEQEVKISILDTGIDTEQNFGTEISGYDYIEDDDFPNDENGHGTQIVSVIYNLINQGSYAQDISLDIRKTHDAQGQGFLSDLIPAIVDAVNDDTDILNLSFSYQDVNVDTAEDPLLLAIDYAEQNGVLVVASAGNSNGNNDSAQIVSYPATYPNANIIATASLDCGNALSAFSSYGSNSVDVAYLGENVPTKGLNGIMAEKSGTSYTTAIITAMAAVLASHQDKPDAAAIKCTLINTSTFSENLNNRVVARGVVDFQSAMENLGSCN